MEQSTPCHILGKIVGEGGGDGGDGGGGEDEGGGRVNHSYEHGHGKHDINYVLSPFWFLQL